MVHPLNGCRLGAAPCALMTWACLQWCGWAMGLLQLLLQTVPIVLMKVVATAVTLSTCRAKPRVTCLVASRLCIGFPMAVSTRLCRNCLLLPTVVAMAMVGPRVVKVVVNMLTLSTMLPLCVARRVELALLVGTAAL